MSFDDAAVVVGLHGQLLGLEVSDDDVVLPAGEEHRRARVALATGAAAQLVVQPLGVVAAGADHVQPAEFGDLVVVGLVGAAEPDVGAAAGHLGGHRDRAELARLGDDRGFLGVVLGVQHDRRDAGLDQPFVEFLRLGDVAGADQHRLAGLVDRRDVLDDGVVLRGGGDVDAVRRRPRGRSACSAGSATRRACRTGAAARPRPAPCRSCRTPSDSG